MAFKYKASSLTPLSLKPFPLYLSCVTVGDSKWLGLSDYAISESTPDDYFPAGEWFEDNNAFQQKASRPNADGHYSTFHLHPDWVIVSLPAVTIQMLQNGVFKNTDLEVIPPGTKQGEMRIRVSFTLIPVDSNGIPVGRMCQLNLHNYSGTLARKNFYTALRDVSKEKVGEGLIAPHAFIWKFPFNLEAVGTGKFKAHSIAPTIAGEANPNIIAAAIEDSLKKYNFSKAVLLKIPASADLYFDEEPALESTVNHSYEVISDPGD